MNNGTAGSAAMNNRTSYTAAMNYRSAITKTTFVVSGMRYRLEKFTFLLLVAVFGLTTGASCFADDWPQWRGASRDGVWKETGLLEKFSSPQLPVKWRAPIGSGYSGPTVANGRVYVTDRITDPATNRPKERVHCLDWANGKPLWTFSYDCEYSGVGYPDGPRAAVTVDRGLAFALGAKGHLHCLDASTGTRVWRHDLYKEYDIDLPIWGIAAAPIVDGELTIVQIGGKGACVVAFERTTGKERWRALPDRASYCAPIIISQAGKRVLVCRTGDRVVGLDPQSGKLYWEYPYPPKQMVIAIATPVLQGDLLFLTCFYDGSAVLRLRQDKLAVEKVWQRCGQNERNTDSLHSIISTPIILGENIYGVDSYGELRCLDLKTGDRIWESDKAVPRARWSTIHFVKNADKVWMINERGDLIIARLSPKGYEEISRAHLLEPTKGQLSDRGGVCWSHPAFANKHIFARNDNELVCASLEK